MIHSLNKAYEEKAMIYMCNYLGEPNNPNDPDDWSVHAPSDFMTEEEQELYSGMFEKLDHGYILRVHGKPALGLNFLFDEDYCKLLAAELTGRRNGSDVPDTETSSVWMPRMLKSVQMVAETCQEMFPECDFYIGDNTDPDGHELLIVIPYEKRDDIKMIDHELDKWVYNTAKVYFLEEAAPITHD